jgi:hypothetical protein
MYAQQFLHKTPLLAVYSLDKRGGNTLVAHCTTVATPFMDYFPFASVKY